MMTTVIPSLQPLFPPEGRIALRAIPEQQKQPNGVGIAPTDAFGVGEEKEEILTVSHSLRASLRPTELVHPSYRQEEMIPQEKPSQPKSAMMQRVSGVAGALQEMIGRPPTREVLSSQRSFLLTKSQAGGRQHLLERVARITTKWMLENWWWLRLIFLVVCLALAPIILAPLFVL